MNPNEQLLFDHLEEMRKRVDDLAVEINSTNTEREEWVGDVIPEELKKMLEKTREWMLTNNIPLLIAYPSGEREDFIITYLKPEEGLKKDCKIEVVTEKVGDMLSLGKCALYLRTIFPKKFFTCEEVERCYSILSLSVRKTTHVECMDDVRTDVCWCQYYINYGTFSHSRRDVIETMLGSAKLLFACYDIDRQDEPEWKQDNPDYPTYSLKELMEDNNKYQVFLDFWTPLPDYEQTRSILGKLFPLNVVDLIMCLTV